MKKNCSLQVCLYLLAAGILFANKAISGETIILKDPLTNPANTQWQQTWRMLDGEASQIRPDKNGLLFELPTSSEPKSLKIGQMLDLTKTKGATIYISAVVKADNVTNPPNPWNGIKLLIHIKTASGSEFYPQAKIDVGTFGPEKKGKLITIPSDAESAEITLGLEQVSGSALFSNLQIKIIEPPVAPDTAPAPTGPIYTGHSLPRLRGAMVPTRITPESLQVFGEEWNGNLIRWQVGQLDYKETGLETPDYDKVLDEELSRLDAALPFCKKYGLYVVLDLHSLAQKTFSSTANQDKLVEVWKKLATKYKDNPVIWGYDIVNEPRLDDWQEGVPLWHALAERVSKEIRKIDPVKPIIIEPELMGVPEAFATLRPISVPNVIYSVHMYNPGSLTHNKVWDKKQKSESYPGTIGGLYWNKDEIERNLKPVIEFQKKYNVHIYVGEFGCVRWSPGYMEYLNDCIEVFEKHGWDWSHHAFREWDGWSVEYDTNPENKERPSTPPQAEQMMRFWLDKNQKPDWTGK